VLGVILVVVLALLCLSGIYVWTRATATNTRTIEAPDGELQQLFRGGVMARHIITSGSLAKLELYDWGVRLCGTMISRWVVPTWEAKYDELAMVKLVALPASRIAVWLRLRSGASAIAFLTERSLEVLPALAKHGVHVDRHVTKIRRVEELYQ
jgi:hypothetical protein